MMEEMRLSDLKLATELEKACFKEPWGKENIRYELAGNSFSHGWLLIEEGKTIGYAFMWELFEKAEIARIGILPAYRSQGYGYLFLKYLEMEAIFAGCDVMTLEVRESNRAALALYKKFGFIQTNVAKHYYPDGENAIYMTKPIGGIK